MMRFFWEAAGVIDAVLTVIIFATIVWREGILSPEKLVTCGVATFSSVFFVIAWIAAGFERSYTSYYQLGTFIVESTRISDDE